MENTKETADSILEDLIEIDPWTDKHGCYFCHTDTDEHEMDCPWARAIAYSWEQGNGETV